jgi:putative ABC transport system permease protein
MIGVLGLTAVNEASYLLSGAFFYSTDAQAVPNLLFTVKTLPTSVVTTIEHLPNVETLQLRNTYNTLWSIAGENTTIEIDAYQNIQHAQLGTFQITSGREPGFGEIVIDESDQGVTPVALGDLVTIAAPDGHVVSLRVVGLARTRGLAVWHWPLAPAIGYMSPEALQRLIDNTSGPIVNEKARGEELLVRTHDPNSVRQTSAAIVQVLDGAHLVITSSREHDASFDADVQLAVAGPLTVMQLLSGLSLLLVCVMLFNSVSTLLSEQLTFIGTMKALGGTSVRIVRSYLITIGIYSLIGTVLGIELGLVAGYQLATHLASLVQEGVGPFAVAVDVGPFAVTWWVPLTSTVVGLLVPPLAALWPLFTGTRITVREAMAAYGVHLRETTHMHPWGHQLHWIPQTAWLGLRGLFRKPGRATLTLLALTLSGTIFLAVQITSDTLGSQIISLPHADVRVDLTNAGETIPAIQVIHAIQLLPNVERVEPVDPAIITIAQRELELIGLQADTHFYQPHLVAGRWLMKQQQGAMVINDFAAQQLHLQVGEQVVVHLEASQPQQMAWTIVGIVHETDFAAASANQQGRAGVAYTTIESLNCLRHASQDAAERLWVQARNRSLQALNQLENHIQHLLNQAGLQNTYVSTPQLTDAQAPDPLLIVYLLFDAMAILVALVGLLALIHTLVASVFERRPEIGVLRSLGATGWRVGSVFWVEGLSLGFLAWSLAALFGLPAGIAIVNLLTTFFGPLDFSYHLQVILTTLLFVLGVVCLASFGPALTASQVRTRDVLRYE